MKTSGSKGKLTQESLRRRKLVILVVGVFLMFFTSMSKMLVPGPIYNQLQSELLFSPAVIATLGAVFMYAYATSQILAGVFSDRYGGVRILLIGGSLFTAGAIGFPLASNPVWLSIWRAFAGLGAGTVFLGVAKLISDLFPSKFGMVLGISLLISYFGPVTGTVPMVWLIAKTSWRSAYLVPGICCLVGMIILVLTMRGTIKKTVPGQTFAPLFAMMKSKGMWLLCLSSALLFGVYYVLLTQIGQKCIEDFYGLSKYHASLCVTFLTIIVALNNIGGNLFLKLAHGNYKTVVLLAGILTMCGALFGFAAFFWKLSVVWLFLSYFLIAIPAGFFPVYSAMGKELAPPESTGLAVSIVNFSAFVFIALWGNLSGILLGCWKPSAETGAFPGEAYAVLFLFLAITCAISIALAVGLPARIAKRIR